MQKKAYESSLAGLLESAAGLLAGARLAAGPFEPAGAWEQVYVVWLKDRAEGRAGTLRLRRQPGSKGAFELTADWRIEQTTKVVQHVEAELLCQGDALGTPQSWRCTSRILQPTREPIDELTVARQAAVRDGVVELSDGRRLYADAPLATWTSNFSLLEAVQRLGGGAIEPISFTMLDFLDLRKDGQTLSSLGRAEVALGGRTTVLSGYQQLGYGVLPWEYWLDEHGRLVVARSGLVGYLAVAEAPKT